MELPNAIPPRTQRLYHSPQHRYRDYRGRPLHTHHNHPQHCNSSFNPPVIPILIGILSFAGASIVIIVLSWGVSYYMGWGRYYHWQQRQPQCLQNFVPNYILPIIHSVPRRNDDSPTLGSLHSIELPTEPPPVHYINFTNIDGALAELEA